MPVSSLANRIAADITRLIGIGEFPADFHLSTQQLADRFQVSRSPVREALTLLAERGLLHQRTNRGFFVAPGTPPLEAATVREDPHAAYYRLAEDWLGDRIAAQVTEQLLRDRYGLTKSQVFELLNRATREGWADRKPGYGWQLLPVAKTPEALEQLYRFRAVIEPAGILEPAFELDRKVAAGLRRTQEGMLAGDIERLPAETLLAAGAVFHESLIRFSGNPFFVQALERVNRLRRLIEHRLDVSRQRLHVQSREHLGILDLLERGENLEASYLMRRHLSGAIAAKSPIIRSVADGP